jgi:hypothetical protein
VDEAVEHLWCAACDVVVNGKDPCACGDKPHKVPHPLDMVDLLVTAQYLAGLMDPPDDFDPYDWDADALAEDMQRRDELLAEVAARPQDN